MDAQHQAPQWITMRLHVDYAGRQRNPGDGTDQIVDGSESSYITTPMPLIHS